MESQLSRGNHWSYTITNDTQTNGSNPQTNTRSPNRGESVLWKRLDGRTSSLWDTVSFGTRFGLSRNGKVFCDIVYE